MTRRSVVHYIVRCTNSVGELLFIYACLLVIGGLMFSHYEHKSLADGLWWAVVTTTTTGYGDLSPATWQGRVTGALIMLLSVFFVLPLMIGYICSHLMENKNEFTDEEQEALKRQLAELTEKINQISE